MPEQTTPTAPKTPQTPHTPAANQPQLTGFGGWLANLFTPGIGFGVINFTRVCLIAMMIFLVTMVFTHYNIHWLIMSILGICLTLSFEFFIGELKKSPEIMNPKNKTE
ncbi:hypothetical protein TRFO_28031 [Tritrichomonas foetus]|uniref:Uncharacterized protein n=1 Tax=Tritrichomonas foetus TaxID=1144522 RepID=A0A1J4K4U2_9EUKA|nr:hypothetical protein TRFO_28031 [Tritrichomonas foetus]|eukprot:OHT04517.1 hypothetical protein TRFO_28031 [Tritrichomonas foetus]